MINVKDQVYATLKDICENVSDGFPSLKNNEEKVRDNIANELKKVIEEAGR